MRRVLGLAVAAMLAGCVTAAERAPIQSSPVTLTPDQVGKLHAAVRARLKDPESARFGGHVAGRAPDGMVWICGLVNAKNSFGGYGGMAPYIGGIEQGITAVAVIANDRTETEIVTRQCARRGLIVPMG